jgi:hypothetical protein
MKTRNLIICIFLLLLVAQFPASAQRDYSTAIGIRGAPAAGLTIKGFLGERAAVEGILSTRWEGFNVTILYEMHQTAFGTANWNFYYGIGGHLGFWDDNPDHPWFDDDADYVVLGVDGIIGLEYTFDAIPFNLSLDWKPAFNLVSYSGFWLDEVGLSVRFVIN